MSFLKEFKEFAMKGNVVDLAVGVVIGGAFGKIVSSLVADLVMPLVGLLVGGINFTSIKVPLKPAVLDAAGKVTAEAVNLNVGNFAQVIFDFAIVAFAIFCVVKLINKFKKEEAAAPAAPPEDVVLLREIRDSLKK
jgi:large conductance mechanosensitive channel